MARRKKPPEEKRNKRIMIYLTENEAAMLNGIAEYLEVDKAKFIVKAMNREINGLANPPTELTQARHAEIMGIDKERVNGYICARGHAFWLKWTWPSPPDRCPCCGVKDIKKTWAGSVYKGFR